MNQQERLVSYINSLDSGHGSLCDRIAGEARKNHVPIIRPETAAFLKTLVAAVKPQRILEVGTAVGYSALLMAQTMPPDAHITTIENYQPRLLLARKYFKMAGQERNITLLEGDAGELLPQLTEPFDFIFMDAAKGQYIHWLPWMVKLLVPGGVLLSDNILQDGDILESRFVVERRNRTIHSRMREYLYTLKHLEELETSIIPLGDGVAFSVRRQTGPEKECDGGQPGAGGEHEKNRITDTGGES